MINVRVVLSVIITGFLWISSTVLAAAYGGGNGMPRTPYQIWTAAQLNTIGANPGDWKKSFILMADIDMSAYTGTEYNIIGNEAFPFEGTFNGNGYVIRNLTYSTSSEVDYVGLFGCLKSASIGNLGLENINLYVASGFCIGGLVGFDAGSTITNCYSTGTICSVSASYVGGLVGWTTHGTITNCFSSASVSSSSTTGGLVGRQDSQSIITQCCSTGAVTTSNSYSVEAYAGGLVGRAAGTITACYSTGHVSNACPAGYGGGAGGLVARQGLGTITNCYSSATVISSSYAGGLVGGSNAAIDKCYSTGPVLAPGTRGGLLGSYDIPYSVTASFWDTQTSGTDFSYGASGVQAKTTVEMRTLSTFTDAGWDFTAADGNPAVWQMPASGYPYLAWKGCDAYPIGDLNKNCMVDLTDFAIFAEHWLEGF